MGIELNKGQLFACTDLEHWWHHSTCQLFELEGAAGTGKTTIIFKFIERIGLQLDDVLFVAYMGKAVSQMIRNGLPAKTIHSSCYDCEIVPYRDDDGKLVYNNKGKIKTTIQFVLKNKIPKNPKLIVIDEAFMVPEKNAKDLLSFGIPTVVLGDTNQLPPVFGKPYFLNNPNVVLTQIMRQKEGDPIIILSQKILRGEDLRPCVMGKSCVMEKKFLTMEQLMCSDIIITGTNRVRGAINNIFREKILDIDHLEYPNVGEKIICRKNNWNKSIKDHGEIFLTNGLSGFVDRLDKSSYNSAKCNIDFRPDFSKKVFTNLDISVPYLNTAPPANKDMFVPTGVNSFEYAYAITTHLSQGSQYPIVTFLREGNYIGSKEDYIRLQYTAVTRARDGVSVVINNRSRYY